MTTPMIDPAVPVFEESLGSALIDAARISVMAALTLLPPPPAPLIILPGAADEMAEDAAATTHGCLEQAMQWLDAARAHTVENGAPVTSLHVARGPGVPP
jgi:hypothetical protein